MDSTNLVRVGPDGTGFVYYKNGSAAIALSSGTHEYQKSFCAFDCDRKGTVLLAIDEMGLGFGVTSSRKAADVGNKTVVLNEKGCLYSEEGTIIKDFTWKKGTPTEPIVFRLNEYMVLTVLDRENMSLEFQCEATKTVVDLGKKQKRNDTYLKNARREPGGRLIPKIEALSLKERTHQFNEACKEKRNKLHPRSQNLSPLVSGIVAGLEDRFEGIADKMTCTPSPGKTWKSDALSTTLKEIPRIPLSGTETGNFGGFGTHIYTAPENLMSFTTLPTNLMTSKGTWKGEVEIRSALIEANPVLKQTRVLKENSGKYSPMIVVDPKLVTSHNPTGMTRVIGKPLNVVKWSAFKKEMAEMSNMGLGQSSNSQISVVLLVRSRTNKENAFERVAEYVNFEISESAEFIEGKGTKGPSKLSPEAEAVGDIRLLKIDVGEDSSIIEEIGIKELPHFLMYQGGKMIYAGPVGGRKVKCSSSSGKPQVLLIESNPRHQVMAEKTLRKNGCDTFLVLTIKEAIETIQRFSMGEKKLIFDLILISSDDQSHDLGILSQKVAELVKTKRTAIIATINMLGEHGHHNLHAVKWDESYSSTDLDTLLLTSPLASIAQLCIQKPIKNPSITKALSLRDVQIEESNFGLTAETLYNKIAKVRQRVAGGGGVIGNSFVGTKLSVEDVVIRGKPLIK